MTVVTSTDVVKLIRPNRESWSELRFDKQLYVDTLNPAWNLVSKFGTYLTQVDLDRAKGKSQSISLTTYSTCTLSGNEVVFEKVGFVQVSSSTDRMILSLIEKGENILFTNSKSVFNAVKGKKTKLDLMVRSLVVSMQLEKIPVVQVEVLSLAFMCMHYANNTANNTSPGSLEAEVITNDFIVRFCSSGVRKFLDTYATLGTESTNESVITGISCGTLNM
jgi:hypothetical protein